MCVKCSLCLPWLLVGSCHPAEMRNANGASDVQAVPYSCCEVVVKALSAELVKRELNCSLRNLTA